MRTGKDNFWLFYAPSLYFLQHHLFHPSRDGDQDLVSIFVEHHRLHRSNRERYVVTGGDLDSPPSPARRDIVGVIDERKSKVEVLAEHQILWPAGELALGVGQELSAVHALEGLDLSGDEHGVKLLLQRLVDSGSDKGHVRIGDLSSGERDAYGGIEVSVEAVLDHRAGRSAFSTVDSQPDVDRLVLRQVRERDTNHGLPEKRGENLESADAWG